MKFILMVSSLIFICTSPILAQWDNTDKRVAAVCDQISQESKNADLDTQSKIGSIEMIGINNKQREGCEIIVEGTPSVVEEKVISRFTNNNWEPIGDYLADGPDGGMAGYYKDRVFCLEKHRYDNNEADESKLEKTHVSVVCVLAWRKVIVE